MIARDALELAIQRAGGQGALAKRLGVPQSLVSYWLRKAKRGVAAERVLEIERITGVSRHVLRPDLYPAPAQVAGRYTETP